MALPSHLNTFNQGGFAKVIENANNQDNGRNQKLLIFGAAIGFLYGLSVRLLIRFYPGYHESTTVMLMSFLVLLPLAMGFVAIFLAEIKQAQRLSTWVFLPWLPIAASTVACMLMFLEGLICVVMFIPLALGISTIGGVLGGLSARFFRSRRAKNLSLACVMVLPFFMAPVEKHFLYQWELREVENTIDIQAPPAVVWRNIERVPPIRRDELPPSWSQRIGFPDPVEATLSHEGVGGVRHATFAGGVLFLETVDAWEPERRLAFSIAAQTDQIPNTTLDEHVRIGGPYFDVLRGEYRLESFPNGMTRLHLSSRHRVSTDFNWYAHLWTDAVMADLQKRILYVVRQRCEREAISLRH